MNPRWSAPPDLTTSPQALLPLPSGPLPAAVSAALPDGPCVDPNWRTQELLLMSEVMRLVGRSLATEVVMREMLHLMSELLGLNRGRIVLCDDLCAELGVDPTEGGCPPRAAAGRPRQRAASIRHAYGLTREEMARGRYAPGEGITGRVLASGQPHVVQDIDAEPLFLRRAVARDRLPAETVAFIALPIVVGGRTLGVLACHRIRSRSRHLSDDVAVLRILATLCGQLLQLQALVGERTRALRHRNEQLAQALETALETANVRYGIVGRAPSLVQALAELERVSRAQASVMLLGESGTGKELFARALHLASPRRDAPFIKMNCAAIPESLFESELFGHERGAFTGAHAARTGWVEQADGGTLFLDEIGELPLALQGKLLRTLQEGTVVRVGSQRERKVDVRVVTATHRDLAQEVAAGRFRADLFYRLHVVPIRLPALRERREDIRLLALHFLSRANVTHERNVHLDAAALQRLEAHPWPGNIRELGNLIERLVLLSERSLVTAAELEKWLPAGPGAREDRRAASGVAGPAQPCSAAAPGVAGSRWVSPTDAGWPGDNGPPDTVADPLVRVHLPLRSHTAQELAEALRRHGGNQSRAAQSLGLTPRQFAYRWKRIEAAR
jgi:Nif-specific regulatory protein